MQREIRDVVCDYGIYEDGKLLVICNSRWNAILIKAILDKDDMCNKGNYVFDTKDYMRVMRQLDEERGKNGR